jgi:CheY-like chemotaxis protein
VLEEADHLNQIVGNLLDLARMRSGALLPTKQAMFIEDVIGSVLRRMRRALEGATVRTKIRAERPPIDADPVQIEQVLSNVLENAIRFSSSGGRSRYRQRAGEGVSRFAWPITDREYPRRTESACSRSSIDATPAEDVGGRDWDFRLPTPSWLRMTARYGRRRRPEGARRSSSSSRPPRARRRPRRRVHRARGLLHDHGSRRRRRAPDRSGPSDVARSERLAAISAATGEQALSLLATQEPDLVVLDLGLPDLDGAEVIPRLRTWSDVPVVVLSVREGQADKIDALDAGADDYVTSPSTWQSFSRG